MITNGTKEKYKRTDFLGKELDRDNIVEPKQKIIEYNQDEFKKGSYYCTAYGCFAAWSAYTGEEVKKERRKIFIEACLSDGLITDGIGGYVDEVVHAFCKFITKQTGVSYLYARADTDDKEIHSRGFNLVTGFKGNTEFKKDRQDNCVIDKLDYGKGSWGHCISEYDYSGVQDNYKGRKCNLYLVKDFDGYCKGENHFANGYFFYTINNKEMSQLETDVADVKKAIEIGVTKNEQELEDIRRGVYTSDNKTTLKIMRSRRIKDAS